MENIENLRKAINRAGIRNPLEGTIIGTMIVPATKAPTRSNEYRIPDDSSFTAFKPVFLNETSRENSNPKIKAVIKLET